MFSADDNAGIVLTLLGVVVVAFCAIGLGMLFDSSWNREQPSAPVERTVEEQEIQLSRLRSDLLRSSERWRIRSGSHQQVAEELEILGRQSGEAGRELRAARLRRSELVEEIGDLRTGFDDYRKRARTVARNRMTGRSFERLELPSGRVYRSVVVRGHGDGLLRIQHAGGSARIPFAQLPEEWRELLHWDPAELEEREEPAIAEEPPQDAESEPRPTRERTSRERRPSAGEERDRRRAVREETRAAAEALQLARSRYLDCRRESSLARSRAYQSNRSVPGSLETWEERAARFDAEARKYGNLYLDARARLHQLDPGHVLLRQSLEQ